MNKIVLICLAFIISNCGETKDKTIQTPAPPVVKDAPSIKPIIGRTKYVKDYGAIGDGIADDTQAIQKALNDGDGTVILERKHKISASLQNRNKNVILFLGQGKAEILATDNSFFKIESYNDIKISAVKVSPPFINLLGDNNHDWATINNCEIYAIIDDVPRAKNYAIKASGKHRIKNIDITDSNFTNTTVFYASQDVNSGRLSFKRNKVTNFKSFVIAMKHSDYSYVENNTINGAMSGTKSVRVMLGTATKETHFKNNQIENIITDVMTSVLYSSNGTLYCDNNTFKKIRGNGNSYVIADKSSSIQKWFITNNTFDQLGVENQKLNGIISGGNNEVLIKNNTFKNGQQKYIQLGGSNSEMISSEISIIRNNRFINTEYPVCINLTFNTGPVLIEGNQVETFKNPNRKKSLHDSMCRFVNITNTNENYYLEDILIKNNTLKNIDDNSSLVWFNTKNGGGISKVTIKDNVMDSGKYLINYRNKETKPNIELSGNTKTNLIVIENMRNENVSKN